MAKRNKTRTRPQPTSGGYLYAQQAEQAFINHLTRIPDLDEVLKKAGITRSRLTTLMYDDEIYQCVEKRQGGLEKVPFRIEPSNTLQAQILHEQLEQWWSEIVISCQNARWYGYSVIEAVYSEIPLSYISEKVQAEFRGWHWIGEKPMEWFEPKNDGRLILLSNYNDQHRNLECDQQFKHFLTQCKATYRNPFGEALFSRLYWLQFFKQGSLKFWAKFVERFGNPLLVGKSNDNVAMRDALLSAHASSVMGIGMTDTVEVLGISGNSGGSAAFEGFDKKLERSIQKLILGQTLTSGTDNTGSQALGKVHLEVQQDKVDADVRMITPVIQSLIDALCTLNQWKKHKIIIGEIKSLEDDKAERDVKLKNAGASFSNQYFEREYGLEKGDLVETESQKLNAPTQFTPVNSKPFSFSSSTRQLSPDQQQVEEITDTQPDLTLLSQDQVNELVKMAISPQDLTKRLVDLLPQATRSEFTQNLEQALFTAEVLGYQHANEGR